MNKIKIEFVLLIIIIIIIIIGVPIAEARRRAVSLVAGILLKDFYFFKKSNFLTIIINRCCERHCVRFSIKFIDIIWTN